MFLLCSSVCHPRSSSSQSGADPEIRKGRARTGREVSEERCGEGADKSICTQKKGGGGGFSAFTFSKLPMKRGGRTLPTPPPHLSIFNFADLLTVEMTWKCL